MISGIQNNTGTVIVSTKQVVPEDGLNVTTSPKNVKKKPSTRVWILKIYDMYV